MNFMINEPELSSLWSEIRERGNSALRPNFAQRVMARANAAREEFNPRSALLFGLGTTLACLLITLAVNQWTAHRASDKAIAQWSALSLDDEVSDQET